MSHVCIGMLLLVAPLCAAVILPSPAVYDPSPAVLITVQPSLSPLFYPTVDATEEPLFENGTPSLPYLTPQPEFSDDMPLPSVTPDAMIPILVSMAAETPVPSMDAIVFGTPDVTPEESAEVGAERVVVGVSDMAGDTGVKLAKSETAQEIVGPVVLGEWMEDRRRVWSVGPRDTRV
eukprot:GFKZ01011571.1.p1 GENE.GFKZ01011571.1~~GFKZ01011571.1.p1  ORF type:complete len:177 (-),score=29.85 GFKZ01011571.1:107-637(-)